MVEPLGLPPDKLNLAVELMGRGDYTGPGNLLSALDENFLKPSIVQAYHVLSSGYSHKKEHKEALSALTICRELQPDNPTTLVKLGAARYSMGDHAGAIEELDRALIIEPENAFALLVRGQAWSAMREHGRAVRDIDDALRIEPKNLYAVLVRGHARAAMGDHAGAIEDLDQILAVEPEHVLALAVRGYARNAMGDRAGAIRDLDRTLQIEPDNLFALLVRGPIRSTLGDQDGAIEDLDKALEIEPENTFALAIRDKINDGGAPLPVGMAASADAGGAPPVPLVLETSYGLLKDRGTLESWQAAWTSKRPGLPKLVVVCASGGGMAAAYWTTLCLTELNLKDPDFPDRVRLVTGSSGGMLGASYYVASLEKDRPRGKAELDSLRTRLGATDFLTPVVRRLVLGDLWSVFYPWSVDHDRGCELERQWEMATGEGDGSKSSLARTFKELAPGEKEGWRPSLVLSPTLVEPGRRLIISNLDLYDSHQGTLSNSVQLFKLFPLEDRGSGEKKVIETLKLSTAVRMNASFPLITPVVPLPFVRPRLRAADAGYLDNYGVDLAASWLERHIDWIARNTGGVALIQIQAYSPELQAELGSTTPDDQQYLTRIARGWEFLTTPLESYTTARKAAMVYANRSHVDRLKKLFEEKTRGGRVLRAQSGPFGFFESAELQCTAVAPLGWSLTGRDRESLLRSLKQNNIGKIERIVEFLKHEAHSPGTPGAISGE